VLIYKVNTFHLPLDEFLLSQQPSEQESIIMGFHLSYIPHYFFLPPIRINVEDVTQAHIYLQIHILAPEK